MKLTKSARAMVSNVSASGSLSTIASLRGGGGLTMRWRARASQSQLMRRQNMASSSSVSLPRPIIAGAVMTGCSRAPSSPPRPVIAVDVDEVLASFLHSFCAYYHRVRGPTLPDGRVIHPSLFLSYHFSHLLGGEEEAAQVVSSFIEGPSPEFLSIPPLEDARAVLTALAPRCELVVVTSRNESISHITRAWLDAHFPSIFVRAVHTNAYARPGEVRRTKGEVCKELGALTLIDDNLHYAMEASTHLPSVILFGSYSWNGAQARAAAVQERGAGGGASAMEEASGTAELPPNVVRASSWRHLAVLLQRLLDHHADASNPSLLRVGRVSMPQQETASVEGVSALQHALLLQERVTVGAGLSAAVASLCATGEAKVLEGVAVEGGAQVLERTPLLVDAAWRAWDARGEVATAALAHCEEAKAAAEGLRNSCLSPTLSLLL